MQTSIQYPIKTPERGLIMIEFACTCAQKRHRAPLEGYDISAGAIARIPQILKDYHRIYLVADKNTYRAAGTRVEEILRENGMKRISSKLLSEIKEQNVGNKIELEYLDGKIYFPKGELKLKRNDK